jgi:multidrug efflux system outer membrane protein
MNNAKQSSVIWGRGRAGALALTALSLTACAVGPDYRPPETAPVEFIAAADARVAETPFEATWWGQFGDPVLDDLVARALSGDLDVKIAAARVAEARAGLSASRRERWPDVGAAVARTESHAPEALVGFDRLETEYYEAGFSTLWEIDLFGRVRRGVEAASADAEAVEAHLRDAQVLVAAEVVRNYLELRGAQKRLAVARQNLGYQRETYELTQVRLELGRGTQLDVASAAASLAATEAEIPLLVAAEAAAANRLAVLLGLRPGALATELAPRDIAPHLTTLAVGTPEDLLRRRPDVRAAERELAAATARIGVAKADLFPRLTLSGFIGFIAGDAGDLIDSQSRAWTATPALSWAGFGSGTRARVTVAEARTDAALASYEGTVLRALEETENAFVIYGQQRERLTSVMQQAAASREAAELARVQYREGALDFLRLLDAERTLLQAEDALARVEIDLNTAVVLIYKALGGGWKAA